MFTARTSGDGTVNLTFSLKKPTVGSIRVYTPSGRLVGQIFKGRIEAGKPYQASIHGISNGFYYAVLSTEEANKVLKISLTR